ncbi:MAG: hypothetical protein J7L73_02530 [Anaerolineales bacterium]|nr:hypothetical protein [Anaerolineales bacterium]
MNMINLVGLLFTFIFLGLIVVFAIVVKTKFGLKIREIRAFKKIRESIDNSVESGSRLHLSIGRGGLMGVENGSALIGLTVLRKIAQLASECDNPPITTSGEATLTILSQDTLRETYREINIFDRFDPVANRLTGFTPFSFAVGVMPIIYDENVSANVLLGHFSSEVAFIIDTGMQNSCITVAGTDDLTGQAVILATTEDPLIGEELYASGAYINAGSAHFASLFAQDLMRWLLVLSILGGVVLKIFGFDQIFINVLGGLP